jgi:hypothetical protein
MFNLDGLLVSYEMNVEPCVGKRFSQLSSHTPLRRRFG